MQRRRRVLLLWQVSAAEDTPAPAGTTLESATTSALDAQATVTGASEAMGAAPTIDDDAIATAVEEDLGVTVCIL